MDNKLQAIVDEHNIAKENALQLIEAFGAPFTEAGEILQNYTSLVVSDESQVELMAEAKEKRLALKRVRTSVENKRKALKEDSLRTGKAIDGIARYIRTNIEPAEEYLERQEKFVEFKEAERKLQLKIERQEKLKPICDNPFEYRLDEMSDEEFETLFKKLVDEHDLKVAQEEAYAREQERIRFEKEAEEKRIREENEVLKKQAEIREAEIAKEREEMAITQEAEIKQVRSEAEQKILDNIRNSINAFDRYIVPNVNGGHPMVDFASVIKRIEQ